MSRVIQEIKEYDSDTCSKIGIRIQDIRESRHMKAIELASYLGIGKNTTIVLYCTNLGLLCWFFAVWRRTHELFAGDGGISKQFKNGDWKNRGRN